MTPEERSVTVRQPPASRVDLAIAAWLHAKSQHSQSAETHRSYEATIIRFRSLLLSQYLDLDAMDPLAVEQRAINEDMMAPHERSAYIAQLVETAMTTIALVAQGFASTPSFLHGRHQTPSPNTQNLRLATISSFYAYALRQGLFHGANPIERVERVKRQPYAQSKGLSQEALVTALDAIPLETPAGKRDYALLVVGLYTGRRLSELAGMSNEHVTVRKAAVEIFWPHCKGGRTMRDTISRRGPQALPAQALLGWLSALETTMTPDATHLPVPYDGEQPIWISLAKNGTFGHRLSLQGIADICEHRLGTSKVHTLRHTFARALEDAGAKVSEIQARLGHASLDTTSRYLAQLRADDNPHLGKLTTIYGLKSHLAPEDLTDE